MREPQIRRAHDLALPNSQLSDFEISWAGEDPWNHGFCLGSENGKVRFVGKDLRPSSEAYALAESGEAINGVAFSNGQIAVSTRDEVLLWNVPRRDEGKSVSRSIAYEGGAHGVRTTASGGFIAPLGKNGLLAIEPRTGEHQTKRTIKAVEKELYYSKAENLVSAAGVNVHACAVRRDGLAAVVDVGAASLISLRTFPGADIVDVQSMGSPELPLSVIALGVNRSLHFVLDVLEDRKSQRLNIDGLCGKGYRVLIARGHVVLLTSERLYVLKDLATRLLSGQRVDQPTTTLEIPIQAVDASISFGEWLLVVMPDGLISFDIEHLFQAGGEFTTSDLTPAVLYDGEEPPRYGLSSGVDEVVFSAVKQAFVDPPFGLSVQTI